MTIDFWTTRHHYGAHLDPIAEAVRALGYEANDLCPTDWPPGGDVLVVGAYRDLNATMRARYPRVVLVEHGVGQSYSTNSPGYSGGKREPYDLLIAPGKSVIDYSARKIEPVGCPKLDPWLTGKRPLGSGKNVLAISWHWDCPISRESGTAFWEYLETIKNTCAKWPGEVLMHGHPRLQDILYTFAKREHWDCELVPDFADVLDRADVYACDNSSTIFEFAATGRPVVLMRSKNWRPEARHGKRFGSWSTVGLEVASPSQLVEACLAALEDYPPQPQLRERVVKAAYAFTDGTSSYRAASAVVRLANI